jgi:ankyrin repeat protein
MYPSVDHQDNAGWTPLAYAIGGRHLGIVEFLHSKHADPQAQSPIGVSLHHLANEQKFDDVLLSSDMEQRRMPNALIYDAFESPAPTQDTFYDIRHTRYTNRSDIPYNAQSHLAAGAYGAVDCVSVATTPLLS